MGAVWRLIQAISTVITFVQTGKWVYDQGLLPSPDLKHLSLYPTIEEAEDDFILHLDLIAPRKDPLVLDLNGDGVMSIKSSQGVTH